MRDIIIKPLVTKKLALLNKQNMYIFKVAPRANKIEIRKAVEKLYNVAVEAVNTLRCRGKTKTRYVKKRMIQGKTCSYKKAIISVRKGDSIDIYSDLKY